MNNHKLMYIFAIRFEETIEDAGEVIEGIVHMSYDWVKSGDCNVVFKTTSYSMVH